MPAGRPTTYSKEALETARSFAKDSTQFEYIVPTVAGLAVVLGVSRDTLYEWGKVHPEFSDMLGELLAKQEAELIQNGLTSIFNPVITKLMLGKHGYSDKQEVTGKDGAPLFDHAQKEKGRSAISRFLGGDSR